MYPLVLSICFRSLRFLSVIVLLFGLVRDGYGQRVYANSQTVQNGSSPIYTPTNNITSGAVDPNHSGYTQWTAPAGLGSTKDLILYFPSSIAANRAVYIRVDDWANITVGTTTSTLSTGRRISAADGSRYIVVVPSSSYNSIVIRLTGNLLSSVTRKVYHAFYEPPNTNCATVLGTSTETGGITLGAIENPELAIDNNLNSYAGYTVALGVASTLKQTAYFSNVSNTGDAVTITFSIPSSILSLSLLSNVTVSAYNGESLISSQSLNTLLTLDLLGLLNSGGRYTVSFTPTGIFDRIEVSMSGVLGALGNLRLHEIQRTPAKPTVPTAYPDAIEVCEGETVSITATSPSAGSILRWYDAVNDGTLLQESDGNSDTYTTSSLPYISPTDTTFIYVASSWESGCPAESERTKIAIVVHPKPIVDPISGQDDICVNEYVTFTSATAGGTWSSADNTVAVVDPLSGAVAGIGAGTVIIRYTLSDAQTSCSNYQEKPVTVHPKPGKPDLSVSGND